MNKRVLIACEESQAVCIEFRKLGIEAWSCDIEDCSGGHPEWHIKDDVINHLDEGWDLMIAHPPCTFLTNAAAVHLFPKGILNKDRFKKGLKAKEFFMKLYNSNIKKIVIENPIPSKIFELPIYDQIIQPFEYGHKLQKKTCLWIKNLPKLIPTNIIYERESTKVPGNWYNRGGKERQKNRSKTFSGIAKAMAKQWSKEL